MQSIPMVNKFPKFFPNDILGIPLNRDKYFGIDLQSYTHPIYIPPDRMSPIETKELKEQLNNLLDKSFIHPSISLYDAVVLFVQKKKNICLFIYVQTINS